MVGVRRHLLVAGSLRFLLFLPEGAGGILLLYTYESIWDCVQRVVPFTVVVWRATVFHSSFSCRIKRNRGPLWRPLPHENIRESFCDPNVQILYLLLRLLWATAHDRRGVLRGNQWKYGETKRETNFEDGWPEQEENTQSFQGIMWLNIMIYILFKEFRFWSSSLAGEISSVL